MQITSSRHGFANAGLVVALGLGAFWYESITALPVNAAPPPRQKAVQPDKTQSASSPQAQGEDVQAQAEATTGEKQGESSTSPVIHDFVATAYSVKGQTASGLHVRKGMIAADPRVLPIGSIVRIQNAGTYSGIYTVLDTGSLVRGRKIDIFTPSYSDAVKFGRRKIKLEIIRYGWEPDAETSSRVSASLNK